MSRMKSSARPAMFAVAAVVGAVLVLYLQRNKHDTAAGPFTDGAARSEPAYDSNREARQTTEDPMMYPPPPPGSGAGASSVRQGPCFRYTVPAGWSVAEDGQFAVVLIAPDQRAVTTMVGNVGLPNGYNPGQYLMERLSQAGYQNLRFGQMRQAQPAFGFPSAWECDVDYVVGGVACHGIARCSVAPNYDFCTMVMTWAASENSQWPNYAGWLPQIAAQVDVTNSAAFGASGIAQQNLQNSIALGEQARRNREHSAQQWDQVTRERGESQDRNNAAFRDAVGGVQPYQDPYQNRTVELPAGNAVYWVNMTTGQIVGDPNPSFDPRTPTDSNWRAMPRNR